LSSILIDISIFNRNLNLIPGLLLMHFLTEIN